MVNLILDKWTNCGKIKSKGIRWVKNTKRVLALKHRPKRFEDFS